MYDYYMERISTHALTEGDADCGLLMDMTVTFQLTPSRRATNGFNYLDKLKDISTHALTEGDDL